MIKTVLENFLTMKNLDLYHINMEKMPKMAILTWFFFQTTLLAEQLKMTAKVWSTTSYKL